jgi:predicted lactoylglutathione lyase
MHDEVRRVVVFALRSPIARSDLRDLAGRVHTLLESSNAAVALCDVEGLEADAVLVDALARLQLAARRRGCRVQLRNASRELLGLVAFMGLADAIPAGCPCGDENVTRAPSEHCPVKLLQGGSMATATRKLFVNLPVADLPRSVEFFTKLGFTFNPQFTDDTATCMVVGDDAFVMLLVEERFEDFTTRAIPDRTAYTGVIMAVSAESRAQVDELTDTALDAGGTPANDPMEMGFMYGRSFHDPDGHLWEVVWMDEGALDR